MKRLGVGLLAIGAVCVLAWPAAANPQTVTGNVATSLSMDTTSLTTTISNWALAAYGSNTTSGGSMTITSNVPYTVNVTSDKTVMSEYNTASSTYVASGKTLTSPLSVTAARSGGDAVVPGVGATAASNGSTLLATGTGLGSDTYATTLSQPTVIKDPRLGTNRTYRMVLTYTVSSTL
jgi:hypothetical protein